MPFGVVWSRPHTACTCSSNTHTHHPLNTRTHECTRRKPPPSIRLRRASKGKGHNGPHAAAEAGVASVLQRMEEYGVPPDDTTRALLASFRGERVVPPVVSRLSSAAAVLGQGEQQRGSALPSSPFSSSSSTPPLPVAQAEAAPRRMVDKEGGPIPEEAAAEAQKRVAAMEAALVGKLEREGEGRVGEEEVLEVLRACVEAEDDVRFSFDWNCLV